MRAKILEIHKKDAYFQDREALIGATGEFNSHPTEGEAFGWLAGAFTSEERIILSAFTSHDFFFLAVKVEELPAA